MEARTNSARFFRGWSKEGAGNREMESDVVSVLISKSYSATGELTLFDCFVALLNNCNPCKE